MGITFLKGYEEKAKAVLSATISSETSPTGEIYVQSSPTLRKIS
jgi:hypothetical protein